MKALHLWKFLALTILSVSSMACSPVYQTSYIYLPIKGREGQMCSNLCLTSKQSCEQFARQAEQQCESQAEIEYNSCEANKRYRYDRNGDRECVANCYCDRRSCDSADTAGCEETFRECHLNCGGEVTANTACTAFCDGALPPATQRLRKNENGILSDVTDEPLSGSKGKSKKR